MEITFRKSKKMEIMLGKSGNISVNGLKVVYMDLSVAFQPLLWLEKGMKTSNIRMTVLSNACFTEVWQWLILNIGERVHPNLMAIHSTGHIGAIGILLINKIWAFQLQPDRYLCHVWDAKWSTRGRWKLYQPVSLIDAQPGFIPTAGMLAQPLQQSNLSKRCYELNLYKKIFLWTGIN